MCLVWELYVPTHVLLEIIIEPFGLWASDNAHKPIVLFLLFIYLYFFAFVPQIVDYYLE